MIRSLTCLVCSLILLAPPPGQAQEQAIAGPVAFVGTEIPDYDRVHDIIERIAALPRTASHAERRRGIQEQQELFDALIAPGPEAAPAIITLMDDDRPLAHSAISLVNTSPDAFEGQRHYGPEVLTDALAAVLNQITGEHFGFIYNGATPAERRQTVDAWRSYLDNLKSRTNL